MKIWYFSLCITLFTEAHAWLKHPRVWELDIPVMISNMIHIIERINICLKQIRHTSTKDKNISWKHLFFERSIKQNGFAMSMPQLVKDYWFNPPVLKKHVFVTFKQKARQFILKYSFVLNTYTEVKEPK